MHETFKIPAKGVSVALAQRTIDKAKAHFGDARYGVLRCERSGGNATVVFGAGGRTSLLDAKALAYELNS